MEPPTTDDLLVNKAIAEAGLEQDFVNSNFILDDFSMPNKELDEKPIAGSPDEDSGSVIVTPLPPLPDTPTPGMTSKRVHGFMNTNLILWAKGFNLKSINVFHKKKPVVVPPKDPVPPQRTPAPTYTQKEALPPPQAINTNQPRPVFSRDQVKDTESFRDRTYEFSINSNESIIHKETDYQENEERNFLLSNITDQFQDEGKDGAYKNWGNSTTLGSHNPFRTQSDMAPKLPIDGGQNPKEKEPIKETAESLRLCEYYRQLYPDTVPTNDVRGPLVYPNRSSLIPLGGENAFLNCYENGHLGVGTSQELSKGILRTRDEQERGLAIIQEAGIYARRIQEERASKLTLSTDIAGNEPVNPLTPPLLKSLFNFKGWTFKSEANPEESVSKDNTTLSHQKEHSETTSPTTMSDRGSAEPDTRETSPSLSVEDTEKEGSCENQEKKSGDNDNEATDKESSIKRIIKPDKSLFKQLSIAKKPPRMVTENMVAKTFPQDFDDDIPLKPDLEKKLRTLFMSHANRPEKKWRENTKSFKVHYGLSSRRFRSRYPFSPQMIGPATYTEMSSEKKKYISTLKQLKHIMRYQKMYINRNNVSDFDTNNWNQRADDLTSYRLASLPFHLSYHFSSTKALEFPDSGRVSHVARGDGNTSEHFKGRDHIRFIMILKHPHGDCHIWKHDFFEPLFIYPDLFGMDNSPVSSAAANILPYTLHLMPEKYLNDSARIVLKDLYTVDRDSSLSMRELFSWKPKMSYKLSWSKKLKFGEAVMGFVGKEYINPFHLSSSVMYVKRPSQISTHPLTSLWGSDHLHITKVINGEVSKFADIIAVAYIQAFMQLTGYKTIGIHNSNKAYTYAFEFFIDQKVIDFGWLLLKFLKISPSDLYPEKFPPGSPYSGQLKSTFPDSLSLMLDTIDKCGSLNEYSKRTIIIAICILKSPYVFKFILRTLLFFVDCTSADTFEEYQQKMKRHALDVQLKAQSRNKVCRYPVFNQVTEGWGYPLTQGLEQRFRSPAEEEHEERERRFIESIIDAVRETIVRENT